MLGHYNSYIEMKIKIYQCLLKQNALTEQTFKIYALFQESLKNNKKWQKSKVEKKNNNRYTSQRSSQYEPILASNKAGLDNLRIFYF